MSRGKMLLKRLFPVLVSAGALTALLTKIEPEELLDALSWRVAVVIVPALLGYGAATLGLEAASMLRLVGAGAGEFRAWTAARIKCASYLLGIVNYALGIAALTALLQRRAGIPLGESASVVLLISFTDLLVVLIFATTGAAVVEMPLATVLAGLFAVAGLSFFGGLAMLRMPASLGPLERIRSLALFDALRTVPLRRLGELMVLRVLFASSFIALSGFAFYAFGIMPPLSDLVVGMMIVAVVAALPIAVAGLGTGQATFVYIFRASADAETLLALSLVLSAGMISLRVGMGLVFAREFTREALEASRRAET